MLNFYCSVTALFCLNITLFSSFAIAAETYKEGDEIEVLHLRSWLPATVIATNKRGEVMAEYQFAGAAQQSKFAPDSVRFAYESGALTRGRTWSNDSGKFKIKAALISIDDKEVVLRKPDSKEITIAIEKLGGPDRAFLQKLRKTVPAGGVVTAPGGPKGLGPALPETESFEALDDFGAGGWNGLERVALTPDPVPNGLKLKQGGATIPGREIFDILGAVIPLGGSDSFVLAQVENRKPGEPVPSRLLWAALAKSKVVGQQLLPGGEVAIDYHTKSHRLLTCSGLFGSGKVNADLNFTVWEVLPTDKEVKPVVRFHVASDDPLRLKSTDVWARFVDGNTILHRWQEQVFVAWDIEKKKQRYRFEQESFFSAPPALSGSRKYLALPEDRRVRIVDTATGETVSTLPRGAGGVAFSPDGLRLASLDRTTLSVWDLTSADAEPEMHQAEAIGTAFGTEISWASPDTLAVTTDSGGFTLFSLKLKSTLWSYEMDIDVNEFPGRRLKDIVDGHLVYATTADDLTSDQTFVVGAVSLPGPKVNELLANTTRESLVAMKRGSPVRLEVRCGEYQARVEAALRKEIEKNGWILKDDAPNVLTAEMSEGQTQNVTYQLPGQASQSASITPHISSIELKIANRMAWSSGTSTGAPGMVRLTAGKSIQSEVDRWNNPNVEFFEKLDVPEMISDPQRKAGLGSSKVTNRGIVPN